MPKKSIKKDVSEEESEGNETEINDEEIMELDEDEEDDEEDDDDEEEDEEEDDKINKLENNGCLIDEIIDDDNIFFDNNEQIELSHLQDIKFLSKENRISSNRLTKYEMVRIIGERTKQLTLGAKPLIKNYQHLSYENIAVEEFVRNITPFKIKRPLPNGYYEIWTLDELNKEHLLSQLYI